MRFKISQLILISWANLNISTWRILYINQNDFAITEVQGSHNLCKLVFRKYE